MKTEMKTPPTNTPVNYTPSKIHVRADDRVSARELYKKLDFDPTHWARWSEKNIINNPYFKNKEDWSFRLKGENSPGRPAKDFLLSIEMAKALSIASGTQKGNELRADLIRTVNRFERLKEQLFSAKTNPEVDQDYIKKLVEQEVARLLSKRSGKRRPPMPIYKFITRNDLYEMAKRFEVQHSTIRKYLSFKCKHERAGRARLYATHLANKRGGDMVREHDVAQLELEGFAKELIEDAQDIINRGGAGLPEEQKKQ